jgi:thioesterase domain-containing protein
MVSYRGLLHHLAADQPVFGVRLPIGARGPGGCLSIEQIAAHCVQELRAFQPDGPYYLLGHSAAGLVAFEVGSQLAEAGQAVDFLGLIDTACPTKAEPGHERLRRHLRNLGELGPMKAMPYLAGCATRLTRVVGREIRTRSRKVTATLGVRAIRPAATEESLTTYALPPYQPRTYPGKLTLFLAADQPRYQQVTTQLGWQEYAVGGFEVREIPADHVSVKSVQNSETLARALEGYLRQAQQRKASVL